MAAAVAGLVASGQTVIEDAEQILTSYPGFASTLADLGATIALVD
jgi:3-phosphoshikimate 1-carboxyvinyltransferase